MNCNFCLTQVAQEDMYYFMGLDAVKNAMTSSKGAGMKRTGKLRRVLNDPS